MHAVGLDDSYRVERVLASGAGGVTELVTLGGSGPFVRKRIPLKLARRGVWGSIMDCGCARLPHVVASYEMPDEFVVICDYIPGENLEQLVASRGRLDEKDARRIVLQLCEAAGALHAHGIVHRDIAPANVVVAADGAHLIDLGIARFRSEGATHDTTQLGTPGFASPEQYGFAQTDARSDVYSLGRVLGYLLTGAMPGVSAADGYERALADESVVSPEARGIVLRATAMEPSVRYQGVEELAAALGDEGGEAQEPLVDLAEPLAFRPASRQRNWAKALLAVMVTVALVAVAAIILAQPGADEKGVGAPPSDDLAASAPMANDVPTGDDAPADSVVPADESIELEIVESGWSVDSQGYVHYALELRNPGDAVVDYPGFTITGRDESGAVLFSQDQILSVIPAGETVHWGGVAGDRGMPPAAVEFMPLVVRDHQVGSASGRASFSVSGVRPVSDGFGGEKFVGEVTTVSDDGADFGSGVALSLVLRDESGAIVFGATGFASRPSVGESTSFEILAFDTPEYATYEVYALQW